MADQDPTPETMLFGLALERVASVCEMMERLLSDPEADAANLNRIGLDFALEAVASTAREGLRAPLSAETRQKLEAFLRAHEVLAKRRASAYVHLSALSAGWECPGCGARVARNAGVQWVRRPPLRFYLVCRCCGERSDPTPEGSEAFEALFADLARGRWNPRANDLEWDGS